MILEVDDPADRRVQLYCGLTDAQLRRRIEVEHGVFVVEGGRGVRMLLGSDWEVQSVLLLRSRVSALSDVVDAASRTGVPVYVATRPVMDRVVGFAVHRGVLALASRRAEPDVDDLLGTGRTVLVVEGVNDHENMGGLFRNAAAFGVGAVFLDPSCCDPLYRRAVRVSMGHVLRVPFAHLEPWPAGLHRIVAAGLPVLALDPAGPEAIERVDLAPPAALLVGAESPGLTEAALALATRRVRISMASGVDSLNVATAAAIALHHLWCHR